MRNMLINLRNISFLLQASYSLGDKLFEVQFSDNQSHEIAFEYHFLDVELVLNSNKTKISLCVCLCDCLEININIHVSWFCKIQ